MSITQERIDMAIEEAKQNPNITHVLVVSDTFDYTTYIDYIYNHDDFDKKMRLLDNSQNMSRVMEVHKINCIE